MNVRKFFSAALVATGLAFGSSAASAADVIDIAIGSDDHKTLVAAVQAAGLVETLQGKGPFTVFAPTDAAFAALPAGTVEDLLKPENKDKLVEILTYHVVPGKVTKADLAGKQVYAKTVQGSSVFATGVSRGEVFVSAKPQNNKSLAASVLAQVVAGNGVVHVIDKVLLPQ